MRPIKRNQIEGWKRNPWSRLPRWIQWTLGVGAILIVIGLASGPNNEGGVKAGNAAAPASFEDEIAASIDGTNAWVKCPLRRTCVVRYRVDVLGLFDIRNELTESMKPVWRKIFSAPSVSSGQITLISKTTSVGGKTAYQPVLRVTCTRKASREIDWDAVQSDGLEALCGWDELAQIS